MTETAVFGGGCFWCTEAIFKHLKGVISVLPGYAGGTKTNPTYEEVGTSITGYAEVIKIVFDPRIIKYVTLLEVFFAMHDSTTMNRQGADVGTQYRSIILYTNDRQKSQTEKVKAGIKNSVTEIKRLEKFYPAKEYHENFYEKNNNYPYCQVVISPKLRKLREDYGNLIMFR